LSEDDIPEYTNGCKHGYLFPEYCVWCNGGLIPKVDLDEVAKGVEVSQSESL